jgi:hypothetical protein
MAAHWVDKTLNQAASLAGPECKRLGIPLRKATKAELDHAIATDGPPVGFVYHWELDPDRRSDPGLHRGHDTFPMKTFLGKCRLAAGVLPTPPNNSGGLSMADIDDIMAKLAEIDLRVTQVQQEVVAALGPDGDSRMDRLAKRIDAIAAAVDA